jgi:hypothetical protein
MADISWECAAEMAGGVIMILGWVEVVVGVIGVGLGFAGKMARSSVVIAIGLLGMGLGRILTVAWHAILGDIGALIVLFGIGMSIALYLRQRRSK